MVVAALIGDIIARQEQEAQLRRARSWQMMLDSIPWTRQDPMDTRRHVPRREGHQFDSFNYRRVSAVIQPATRPPTKGK